MPSVSVIIPTLKRPAMLKRAVLSVLQQSFQDFEVIVIIDGPDEQTVRADIRSLDARIRVVSLAENVGLAEARNIGIRHARARWVALLDDDDEWLPDKLRLQVVRAIELGGDYVFVPCKFIERTDNFERIMPPHLPAGADNFSEYIYCEQGYLQPSMFFMSRALCEEVPFTAGLRHVEDSDWLLRATQHRKIQVGSVDQALSIYYNLNDGKRESEITPWEYPMRWAVDNHDLFTRRAFPFYIARIGINARRAGEPLGVLFFLMKQARLYGTLNAKALTYFFAYWFLPSNTLRRLRVAFR
jgi:glycosyltransferase involved in cell wall biosynthesis